MSTRIMFMSCCFLLLAARTASYSQSRDPAFSPDGRKIVFVSIVDGVSELFTMHTDGTDQRQLLQLEENCYYPFYSPDGSRIVFMSAPKEHMTVCVVDADGSNFRRLTTEDEENADPHWFPDGKRIIYYSARDGNDELYTMRADGTNQTRITNNTSSEQTPSISRDGTTIVFVSDRDGNTELYTMDLNGEHVRRLTFDPRSDRVPSWSPDGTKIVWYSRETPDVAGSGSASWNGAEIYKLELADLKRRQLTQNCYRDHGPVYSPDGRRIVFTSGRTGQREVFIMDATGENVKQLTFGDLK